MAFIRAPELKPSQTPKENFQFPTRQAIRFCLANSYFNSGGFNYRRRNFSLAVFWCTERGSS